MNVIAEPLTLPLALFRISELAHSLDDIETFCAEVHEVVRDLVPAENLYIAIRGRDERLRMAYFADSEDYYLDINALNEKVGARLEDSLTAWAMHQSRTVHLDAEGLRRVCEDNGIELIGSTSADWLAVPLIWQGDTLGVLVVQSYDPAVAYDADHAALLEYVCAHIANLLTRRWTEDALRSANEDLEQRVRARTRELVDANRHLEKEVAEREHGERLQKALFQIAQLASEPLSTDAVFHSIHAAIADLINARNLFIALADWDAGLLRFPYYQDDRETEWSPIPIASDLNRAGPTMRILGSGEPLLYREGVDQFPERARGVPSKAWLGVPLKLQSSVVGVLAVQSYDDPNAYNESDLDLMIFVGRHIAITLDRRHNKVALEQAHNELEKRVRERTVELREANAELRSTLRRLEDAQTQLVESEKLASLGGLVAGMAHEINTPLGVAVTAATHLDQRVRRSATAMENGEMAALEPAALLKLVAQPLELVLSNLSKSVQLVSSFKQVTADQFTEDRRAFDLGEYLLEILTSLSPKIRKAGIKLEYRAEPPVPVESYPHAYYPILSNLVMNAIVHAFDQDDRQLVVELSIDGDEVQLDVADNGCGMTGDTRRRLFDPFLTTRRGSGGTGLGMHIVYNHVAKLGGRIHCESNPGAGTHYEIRLPRVAPNAD